MKAFRNLIICVVSLSIITACKDSSRTLSKNQERTNDSLESIYIEPLNIPAIDQTHVDLEKITHLQKFGAITEGFSNEELNFFANVTDLCVDKEDNLYVADSKLHSIFKFNKNQEFLFSFGQEGQGPGEFMGRLRISAGNDGNIYISDHGSYRFYIFSSNGKFIRQFRLPRNTLDVVVANSRGEMYLFSESGYYVVDCFNSSFRYLRSLLEVKYKHDFPVEHPSKKVLRSLLMRPPRPLEVHKILSKNDHLFLIFNNSLVVVYFDQNNKLVNQFRIDHPGFIKDYGKRLRDAKKAGGWINCFGSAFLDDKERICLCYFNSEFAMPEIYRYQQDGKFVDRIRIKDLDFSSNEVIRVCDSFGNFYGIDNKLSQISIYKIP